MRGEERRKGEGWREGRGKGREGEGRKGYERNRKGLEWREKEARVRIRRKEEKGVDGTEREGMRMKEA